MQSCRMHYALAVVAVTGACNAYSFAVRRLDPLVPLCHNVALVAPNGEACLGSHNALALTGLAEERL